MKKINSFIIMCAILLLMNSTVFAVENGVHIEWIEANTDVRSGDEVTVYIHVSNDMTIKQSINIEAGIFADSVTREWGLMALINPPLILKSCAGEIFVSAREITLEPHESAEFEIKVTSPYKNSKLADGTSNWDSSHSVVVGLYDECGGGYHTSNIQYGSVNGAWKLRNINVWDEPPVVEPITCGNGIIEKGEDCYNCPKDVRCSVNQICTFKKGVFLISEDRYECDTKSDIQGCIVDGDCDDGNVDTIDCCIGVTPRHCSYICTDKYASYDKDTGLCTVSDESAIDKLFTNVLIFGGAFIVLLVFIFLIIGTIIYGIRR